MTIPEAQKSVLARDPKIAKLLTGALDESALSFKSGTGGGYMLGTIDTLKKLGLITTDEHEAYYEKIKYKIERT